MMMKNTIIVILLVPISVFAQIDKEQLALKVSKVEVANTLKLKGFIWKRHTSTSVEGVIKSKVVNELSFDENGVLQITSISTESSVKKKRGIRGAKQKSAMEDNADYVESALNIAMAYTYTSKGQLLDFFEKATITEQGNVLVVTAINVNMQGDKLTIVLDKESNLYISRKFSSLMGNDLIEGEIKYEKFSSGINHVSETIINLPAKKAKITAVNQDYSQRIN